MIQGDGPAAVEADQGGRSAISLHGARSGGSTCRTLCPSRDRSDRSHPELTTAKRETSRTLGGWLFVKEASRRLARTHVSHLLAQAERPHIGPQHFDLIQTRLLLG